MRKSRARLSWGIAGLAVSAAAAFAVGYFTHRPPKPEQIRFFVQAPEGVTFIDSPRVSPDGRHVAFNMTDSSGVNRI